MLTDKQRKEIIASYIECENYSEVARKFDVADNTVRDIVLKDEEIAKKLEQKHRENTDEVLEAMKKRSKRKIQLIDKIFDAMDGKLEKIDMFTNIKDLATAYGIIMDKELKVEELKLKKQEIGKDNNKIQRIEIINDLPQGEEENESS